MLKYERDGRSSRKDKKRLKSVAGKKENTHHVVSYYLLKQTVSVEKEGLTKFARTVSGTQGMRHWLHSICAFVALLNSFVASLDEDRAS